MKSPNVVMPLLVFPLLVACQPETPPPDPVAPSSAAAAPVTQLEITDLAAGAGAAIEQGATAVVHYTGWLFDPAAPDRKGQKFDSSRDRGQPFRFPLGAGRVIQGWDRGVEGMKVGGQRVLVIPPELAYGERGAGGVIPPGATLLFEVELLGIEDAAGAQ
ncbi:MAG TPA: FKBP-type peptidyl-prolyl cis-trans isomerase [Steroidobacteraceae bacterium]|nr:FKBP-type peptidyl-prolyl cis-trans isomerase [Steroidobacteraceae bacterium]